MGRFPTPAEGYPVIELVKDLKNDLRDAVDRDVEEHQKLFSSIDGVKEQISQLRMESASNTASLARIEVSITKRKPVDPEVAHARRLSNKLVGIISGIVALGTALVTYLASH